MNEQGTVIAVSYAMENYTYLLALLIMLAACGGNNTSSPVQPPGDKPSAKDRALNAGADLLQDKIPLQQFNTYLDGFHFYSGNMNAQMEAHHYVDQVNDDLYQAIIFDGNGPDAKLMGVEYIITANLFATLPAEEKKLWHSHQYEVKSGTLIAPGIPEAAEHTLMEKIVGTYGKTIHTWHTDQSFTIPVGTPMLMMGFTRDGQVHPELVRARDERFKVSTPETKKNRANITPPPVDPLANAWEKGEVRQFIITNKPDSALQRHQGPVQRH